MTYNHNRAGDEEGHQHHWGKVVNSMLEAATLSDAASSMVTLTENVLQSLHLLDEDVISDLELLCVGKNPVFETGQLYKACHFGEDDVCVLDEEGTHHPIPFKIVEEHFKMNATQPRMGAIFKLAEAAMADRLVRLQVAAKAFMAHTGPKFKKGDLVRWKDGMSTHAKPFYGETVLILEVLAIPKRRIANPGSSAAASMDDIVIGLLDDDGELIHFLMDSRRFEHAS